MSEPESNDQDFNEVHEDFDFGEETPEIRSFSHQGPMNKKLLLLIFGIIMTAILGFGYRFYKPRDSIQKIPLIVPEVHQTMTDQTIAKTEAIDVNIAPSKTPAHDLEQAFAATDTTAIASKPLTASPASTAPTAQPLTTPTTSQPVIAPTQQELFDKPVRVTDPEVHVPIPITPNTENSLSAEMMKQLTQSLDKLNQQIDYIFGKINYLDSYTHEVSQNLEKLNQSISIMDQRLSSLSNTTHALSEDVGGVKNEVSHVKETLKDEGFDQEPIRYIPEASSNASGQRSHNPKTQGLTPENPEYLVHAVIPGRAWLKSSKGAIITVAEGDTIGNYGKVLLIDAAHGLVLTSSGITFR